MKKNDTYTVTCTDLTDQGYGVARVDGQTVFIQNLLPGEEAEILILKAYKKYAIAKVLKRLTESKQRTQPACDKAGRCGGCSFMHMDYKAQLAWKQKQLQDLFSKVSPQIRVLPVLGMQEPYHYRNKAQFPVRVVDGKVVSGFYKSRTNDIVDTNSCLIQDPVINEVFLWIKENIPVESARELRHIFIRASRKSHQVQVVFIGRGNIGLEAFTAKLVKRFPEIKSVLFNKNIRDDNVILGEQYDILYGSDSILETCMDLEIELHFKSFFQVNPEQMEVLYSKALELADIQPDETVIDLYAGTGTIGMLASKQAKEVIGVEIVPEAVENAMNNVRRNHIENARYICQDATQFAAENSQKADVVIVDPPRKGMSEQGIVDICTLSPDRLVYISCNPHTLARDLKIFARDGYICKEVQPVDMFAHSNNVECVALLKKK